MRNPINDRMNQGIRDKVFPGAVLLVAQGDAIRFFKAYGHANLFSGQSMTRDTVFDLASLTKPLATSLAVIKLVDQQRIGLDQTLENWLPALSGSDKAQITVRQLLCHRSGLPAHRLFSMTLQHLASHDRPLAILEMIRQTPLESVPGTVTCYSDLGFMLLCRLVEAVAECPLDRFLRQQVYEPMGIRDLFFVDLTSATRPHRAFAATELCPVRMRLLSGEVHDDNAWFAGGIDGQAGLFGTAEAVFRLLRHLVAGSQGQASPVIFSAKSLLEMLHGTQANPLPLGFDRPAAEQSSAGHHFSSRSVGHLGFTGTSFWLDLDTDRSIILLTNRVHPTRWNDRLRRFRPLIHDEAMEHFEIVSD